jgi:three-Cys-motif partner protein
MAQDDEESIQDVKHEFGAQHTEEKLRIVSEYLPLYTTALKLQPFHLHYIDAFAGAGICNIKVKGERMEIEGSASIAARCNPPFHRMVFIEKERKHIERLHAMLGSAAGRNYEVIQGDANDHLPGEMEKLGRGDRAIVFIDPYGMQLDWTTLASVARSKVADVWYLFPLSGFYRQAARDSSGIDADKRRALTRMMGTDEWETDFYAPRRQSGLFDDAPGYEREAGPMQMLDWVTKRLGTIFPYVAPPKVLYAHRSSGAKGAPLFALYFSDIE